MIRFASYILLAAALSTSQVRAATSDVWVYTSIYKDFIGSIQKAFETKYPQYRLQIYQAGSEKIQAKLEAEMGAGRPQADLLVISDPFYGVQLEKRGLLERVGVNSVTENYQTLMVLIANRNLPQTQRPKAFSDLRQPAYKNQIQMGSPLESGTMFAAVASLSEKYGWEFFEKLRKNGLASSGGNAAVIQKVESGEKKIGMVLLENALAVQKKGSPIDIIYPADGAIPIPSVQVVLKSSVHKEGAKAFAAFLLTPAAQKILVDSYMYSVDPKLPPPPGARALKDVTGGAKPWTPEVIRKTGDEAKAIKEKFAEIVLE